MIQLQHSAFTLASLAECGSPDGTDSPGGKFLTEVQDAVNELPDDIDDANDSAAEIADSAVPIYTHPLWLTFVDLLGYQEDMSEIQLKADDSDAMPRAILYTIAERLAATLIAERTESGE